MTDPLIDTPSHRAHAHTQFNLFFTIDDGDREVKFSLEPNNDIIPPGAVVQYLGDDGTVEHEVPLVRADYRVYKGNAWVRDEAGWTYSGWARIIISKDGEEPIFEGAFSLDHDTHHVLSRTNYLKTRDAMDPMVEQGGAEFMVVFKDSDVVSPFKIQARGGHGEGIECPSDRLEFNSHPDNPVNQMILTPPKMDGVWGSLGLDSMFGDRMTGGLSRRQSTVDGITSGNSAGVNLKTSVGSTDGCPNTRMVALIGVATDCTYTGDFDSEALARANVIKQINSASDLYEKTFNITLGLSQLVISKQNCPGTPTDAAKWNVACSSNVTIENRLNLFSEWRGQRSNDTLALWTLLTTCETGSSVGLAWLGQLCQGEANTNSVDGSFVSGANVIARTATEWQVIAHEIGHTMGAVHDCTSDTCQDSSAAAASMCCPLSATVCNANGQYIMNPSTSESITSFSP